MAAKHAAEAKTEPDVQADGRPVEHFPEPDEGLANGEFNWIDIREIFSVQGDVLRVERKAEDVARKFAGEGDVGFGAMGTAEIKLVELITDDFSAAFGRAM